MWLDKVSVSTADRSSRLTLWYEIFQNSSNVKCTCFPDRRISLFVRDDEIGTQIMCAESKGDTEIFVPKDALFVSKDRVCELGVEALDCPRTVLACLNQLDGDSFIRIRRP